ncbi:MAG TPA: type II toxin-antitoxin system VapC family toxin [Caulobacteraceae bacterium]|nr:type II toxin-antitoxin system VapC family toxin [Caulobacteraceae bacterium]
MLDASAAVAWLVAGQNTPSSDALLEQAHLHDFEAPHIFPVEVRNALLKIERVRRSDPALTAEALEAFARYNIEIEAPPAQPTDGAILDLARSEGLSVYDALYFWHALRKGLALATRDGGLLAAATSRGLNTFDLRR